RLPDAHRAELVRLDQPVDRHVRDAQEVRNLVHGEQLVLGRVSMLVRHRSAPSLPPRTLLTGAWCCQWWRCGRADRADARGAAQPPPRTRARSVAAMTAASRGARTPWRASSRRPAAVVPPGEVTAARSASGPSSLSASSVAEP